MISVIIPTKDRPDLLKQCIVSFFRNAPEDAKNSEVIIVETGDMQVDAIKDLRDLGCRLYGVKGGTFAQACNLGGRIAKGEHLLLCNNDIIFQDNIISPGVIAGEIIGHKLIYPNGLIQHGGIGFDIQGNPYHQWRFAPKEHPTASRGYPVPAVTFALAIIRHSLWRLLGGLDESYINAYEDIDFCLRAAEVDTHPWYRGERSAVHLTEQTAGRNDHVKESWDVFVNRWMADGRLYRVLGMWPVEKTG